jgi:hypothetical protein
VSKHEKDIGANRRRLARAAIALLALLVAAWLFLGDGGPILP